MKKLLLLFMAALLLSGCAQEARTDESMSNEENPAGAAEYSEGLETTIIADEEQREPTDEQFEKLRSYACTFAQVFDSPFSDADELDPEKIGEASLNWISSGAGADNFERDSDGNLYIPKIILQAYVLNQFGIADYELPLSSQTNDLPMYDEDSDSYLFGGTNVEPQVNVEVLQEQYEDGQIKYTMELDFPDKETGETQGSEKIVYTFEIVGKENELLLRIVSAEEVA